MTLIIIFILGVLVGVGTLWFIKHTNNNQLKLNKDYFLNINKKKKELVNKRKKEILEFMNREKRITNTEVRKMFNISEATAVRYLDGMENDKLLIQKGSTGRNTYYELTKQAS